LKIREAVDQAYEELMKIKKAAGGCDVDMICGSNYRNYKVTSTAELRGAQALNEAPPSELVNMCINSQGEKVVFDFPEDTVKTTTYNREVVIHKHKVEESNPDTRKEFGYLEPPIPPVPGGVYFEIQLRPLTQVSLGVHAKNPLFSGGYEFVGFKNISVLCSSVDLDKGTASLSINWSHSNSSCFTTRQLAPLEDEDVESGDEPDRKKRKLDKDEMQEEEVEEEEEEDYANVLQSGDLFGMVVEVEEDDCKIQWYVNRKKFGQQISFKNEIFPLHAKNKEISYTECLSICESWHVSVFHAGFILPLHKP